MTDSELERAIYKLLARRENDLIPDGLGFVHKKLKKKLKKLAKKIAKKVKKVAIPAGKIALGFAAGGPMGASAVIGKLTITELERKKMKKAIKKAEKKNKEAIAKEMLIMEGVNMESDESEILLQRYMNSKRGFMDQYGKFVLPAAGLGLAAVMILKG